MSEYAFDDFILIYLEHFVLFIILDLRMNAHAYWPSYLVICKIFILLYRVAFGRVLMVKFKGSLQV